MGTTADTTRLRLFHFLLLGRQNIGLKGQRSHQQLEHMLCGVPHEVLPIGQNQCPVWQNIKFSENRDRIHPESLEKAARIHISMSLSWDGQMAILQSFYYGLTPTCRAHIDDATSVRLNNRLVRLNRGHPCHLARP